MLRRIRTNLEDAWLTPLVAGHNAGRGGLLVRAKLGADGEERWRFEAAEAVRRGDIVITKRGDGKKPKGDDGGTSPGR